jgi:uncharacterized Ntn-hydrolase superfamily protein
VVLWLVAPLAGATWSIVATDGVRGEIGGAAASCVGDYDLNVLLGAAPGAGALHSQSFLNTQARDLGAELLAEGATPEEVIAAITDPAFDVGVPDRQYGVVDVHGRAAAFTGDRTAAWSGHTSGVDGAYTYSVQGNTLTGEAVLTRAEAAFVDPAGCDLADRLIRGLEAGAEPGEGDARCVDDGIPADAAYLRVLGADGALVVGLSVTDTAPQDALVALRGEYDAWRAAHACPAAPPVEAEAGCGCGHAAPGPPGLLVAWGVFAALRSLRRERLVSPRSAAPPTQL